MKRATSIQAMVFGLALICGAGGAVFAADLPQEPGDEYLINEDVNIITGFYIREYSLGRNGVADYRTARQIVLSEYNEYWNTVVQTEEFPLFYWHDANEDGQFEMWIDRKVEGCLCDIVPYRTEAPTE
ncbi:MAG: hypothetical protein V3R80_06265 [Candidatus Tectomicrobia bacterium]